MTDDRRAALDSAEWTGTRHATLARSVDSPPNPNEIRRRRQPVHWAIVVLAVLSGITALLAAIWIVLLVYALVTDGIGR